MVGLTLEAITRDMRGFWRELASESSSAGSARRRGCIHLATAAVVNAVWDLWAKIEGKPLWRLLVDLEPQQLVAASTSATSTDALTPEEALELLDRNARRTASAKRELLDARLSGIHDLGRLARLHRREDRRARAREALAAGFTHVKMKVGRDLAV